MQENKAKQPASFRFQFDFCLIVFLLLYAGASKMLVDLVAPAFRLNSNGRPPRRSSHGVRMALFALICMQFKLAGPDGIHPLMDFSTRRRTEKQHSRCLIDGRSAFKSLGFLTRFVKENFGEPSHPSQIGWRRRKWLVNHPRFFPSPVSSPTNISLAGFQMQQQQLEILVAITISHRKVLLTRDNKQSVINMTNWCVCDLFISQRVNDEWSRLVTATCGSLGEIAMNTSLHFAESRSSDTSRK